MHGIIKRLLIRMGYAGHREQVKQAMIGIIVVCLFLSFVFFYFAFSGDSGDTLPPAGPLPQDT